MARNPSLDLDTLRTVVSSPEVPWEMSFTAMTALTEDEREIRLGVPLPPGAESAELEKDVDTAELHVRRASGDAIGAPLAFDLRHVNGTDYTTPVRDQRHCGSCVAFGVVATMEGVTRYTRGLPMLPVDYSEAHLFYCHGYKAGARCNKGWMPDGALTAARDIGVTSENYYPYTDVQQACTGLDPDWKNRLAKIDSFKLTTGDPAAMKQHISAYGSVVAVFYVYQDFFSYRSGIYKHVAGEIAGGHCVCLVGYDDAQGCWIAKNSWGPEWGENGFFRIAYGQCQIESWQTAGVPGVEIQGWDSEQELALSVRQER